MVSFGVPTFILSRIELSIYVKTTMSTENTRPQQKYYNSQNWKSRRLVALQDNPICEVCGERWATDVHHVLPWVGYLKTDLVRAEELFYNGDVACLCKHCHLEIHKVMKLTATEIEIIREFTNEDSDQLIYLNWQLQHIPK